MKQSTFVNRSESELGIVAPTYEPIQEPEIAIESAQQKSTKKGFWDHLSEALVKLNEGAVTVQEIIDSGGNTSTSQPPKPSAPPGNNTLKIVGMTAAGVVGVILMAKLVTPNKKS